MADNTTRSGLLWEVERILTECKELEKIGKGYMPNCLILENVIQVHSERDMEHFRKWINRLEQLGYQNYWQDLIATDYGIPQTRNRCFMVSLYGDYSYTFPKPIDLKLRLKDLLEEEVDEKYFLSEKQINDIKMWKAFEKPLEVMEKVDKEQISPTITTRSNEYTSSILLIKNNNSKGYLEARDGDGIDISGRMQYHRGTIQKQKCQTLTTGGADVGVVINASKRNNT